MERKLLSVMIFTAIACIMLAGFSYSCNEHVCASIVSKCMLTQSCKCDLKNCSCCKECHHCLSYLYTECCSCVEMCPKPNDTRSGLSKQSHVAELEGIPGLFDALTDVSDDTDDKEKWTIFSFPVDFDAALFGSKKDNDYKMYMHSTDQNLDAVTSGKKEIVTYNCTVVYMNQCMSWKKCKDNCLSMGASSFRWFHDACCECVGETCLNYGINESRCLNCPENKYDEVEEMPNEDDLDYGEGMGPLDSSVDTNI